MIELEGLDHVALGVQDLELSAKWYMEVLGFEHRYQGIWNGVPVWLARDKTALALFPRSKVESDSTKARKPEAILHLAMRATRQNFVAAQEELKRRGIPFHFQDHEISHSIYFKDPDGIQLEITTYEVS